MIKTIPFDVFSAEPIHPVRDIAKRDNLVESMLVNGWNGPPLLVYTLGNGWVLLNGSHRYGAIIEIQRRNERGEIDDIDLEIPIYVIDGDALEVDEDWIGHTGDDEERLAILDRVDPEAAEILRQEMD